MYSICFAGEYFFPEPVVELRCNDTPYVCAGRLQNWNGEPLYSKYMKDNPEWGSSRQMTNVFNIFVVMSIFNILNARIINDDKNIFRGVHKNPIFCLIFVGIIIAQVIIV